MTLWRSYSNPIVATALSEEKISHSAEHWMRFSFFYRPGSRAEVPSYFERGDGAEKLAKNGPIIETMLNAIERDGTDPQTACGIVVEYWSTKHAEISKEFIEKLNEYGLH
jgi:hypothetical protein